MPEDEIDLERVVHDPRYRRQVVERLKREDTQDVNKGPDTDAETRRSRARVPSPSEPL